MSIKELTWIALASLLAACGGSVGPPETSDSSSDPRGQCSEKGNSAKHRCQVSFVELFLDSASGKYVDVIAFNPGGGVGLVFSDEIRSQYEDYSSSLVVYGNIPSEAGYVLLSGLYKYDRSDLGVGTTWSRQVGSIDLVRPGVEVKSRESRLEECAALGCVVYYLDGSQVK